MSNTQNTLWLESHHDVFQYALETNDFALAQQVIHDLLESRFDEEAFYLAEQLQKSDLYQRYEAAPKII